jgi:cell shape-determining protein MreC
MNHHLAKTYRRRRFYAILAGLFVLVFFLFHKGFFAKLNPFFTSIVRPFWEAKNFSKDYLALTLESKKDLLKQNILLKKELRAKEIENTTFASLQEENETLKEILGRVKKEDNVLLAAILSKPNVTPYDVLIIDIPKDVSVEVGNKVFGKGNILLGEIESVSSGTARVLMYSTPGNITQVVLNSSGKYFNAHGRGGGVFEVDVPRELVVNEGDNFFYPGLETILIGVAKKVEFESRDSFKKSNYPKPD